MLTHIDGQPTDGLADLLLGHNHQPGVAPLLELLVAAQPGGDDDATATATATAIVALLQRAAGPPARRSAIVCLFHVQQLRPAAAPLARRCLDAVLPWTMGKDFGIRVLAQFVCQRIVAGLPAPERAAFAMVAAMLDTSLAGADQRAEYERLSGDWRFAVGAGCAGDARRLVAPVLVLHDLPLLAGLCPTEVIPLRLLGGGGERTLTEKYGAAAQVSTRPAAAAAATVQTTPVVLNVDNVQRKIVPLRQMFPEWADLWTGEVAAAAAANGDGGDGGLQLGRPVRRGALVMVASLLTKDANVGGLARTCEIFGAQELVVANLKVTESREFQALR